MTTVADIKVRSWGAAGRYGISPLSDRGRRWVYGFLNEQRWSEGPIDDGAVLFADDRMGTVIGSVKRKRLVAIAGIGPDSDGEAYEPTSLES